MPGVRFRGLTLKKTVCVRRDPRAVPAGVVKRENRRYQRWDFQEMLGDKRRNALAVGKRQVRDCQEEIDADIRGSKAACNRTGPALA